MCNRFITKEEFNVEFNDVILHEVLQVVARNMTKFAGNIKHSIWKIKMS